MRTKKTISTLFLFFALSSSTSLNAAQKLWQKNVHANQWVNTEQHQLRARALNAGYLTINSELLAQMQAQIDQSHTLQLPLPDGQWLEFSLEPSPVLSPSLANKYPQLMTYSGTQVGKPTNYGRFSLSPQGFFGFYRINNEWFLLSPQLISQTDNYMVYRYQDAIATTTTEALNKRTQRDFLLLEQPSPDTSLQQKNAPTGEQIRTYRLAISSTGEYGQKLGGTTANVVAESMILLNRINQILLSDLAIQFELIDSEAVMFTDPNNDPYTNSDVASDIDINQTTVDNVIGPANYDIGHLLSTNGGGLAGVGVVCRSDSKALGTTGATKPTGERFYIDLVAHELGHQLGARHSFNAQDNSNCDESQRSAQSAFEPGSGSTIMSYAGLCSGQNLQSNSDPYFHAGSLAEIRSYVESFSGRSCGSLTQQSNAIPQVQLDASAYTIPANTAFVLSASASDADGDPILYNWEQINAGGTEGGTANGTAMKNDNGFNPLFRSYPASTNGQRYFPQLSSVMGGQLAAGEIYPNSDRSLTLRLTAKDNKGGVNSSDVEVEVVNNQQRFAVTAPDSAQSWTGFSQQTIRWDVAGTNQSPYNCTKVDILLSSETNGDFDSPLALAVANDGEHEITVPNIATTSARLMLKCSNNVFYALNSSNLSIMQSDPIAPLIVGQTSLAVEEDSSITLSLANLLVDDVDSVYPDDFSLSVQEGDNYQLVGLQVVPNPDFNGQLNVVLNVNDGSLESEDFTLAITVNAINDAPIAENDSVSLSQNAQATLIDVLANDSDIDSSELTLTALNYSGQGSVSISNQQISYQPASGFSGPDSLSYTLSDGQLSSNATVSIQVNALPVTPTTGGGGGAFNWDLLYLVCGLWFVRRKLPHEDPT